MREELDPKPSLATISKDVGIILGRWARELLPDERKRWILRDLRKLAEMERVLDEDLYSGNVDLRNAALNHLYRIQQRRAKLLGLDAPSKTAFTDPTGLKEYRADVHEELYRKLDAIAADHSGDLSDVSEEGQSGTAGKSD